MKLKDIQIGKTGYTTGYGADRYPHTVVEVGAPFTKRGRKPKGWVKGSKYVNLMFVSDELIWSETEPDLGFGSCTADTGANGNTKRVVFKPGNGYKDPSSVTAVLLPTDEVVCNGLGYRSYNRDSSF